MRSMVEGYLVSRLQRSKLSPLATPPPRGFAARSPSPSKLGEERGLSEILCEEFLGPAVGQPRRFLASPLAHFGGEAVILAGIVVQHDFRVIVQPIMDGLLDFG